MTPDKPRYGTGYVNGDASYTGQEGETVTVSWQFYDSQCYLDSSDSKPHAYDSDSNTIPLGEVSMIDDVYQCTFTLSCDTWVEFPFAREPELYQISFASGVPGVFLSEDETPIGSTVMAEAGTRLLINLSSAAPDGAVINEESVTHSGPGEYVDMMFIVGEGDAVISFDVITPYILTVTVSPADVGTCDVATTWGPQWPVDDAGTKYYFYEAVEVILSPDISDEEYRFDHYEINGTTQTNENYRFTITGNMTVKCVFVSRGESYIVTPQVSPAGAGELSLDGDYWLTGSDEYACYEGTTLEAEASANANYEFDHFEINGSSYTDNPYSFTVNGNVTVVAVFRQVAFTITTSVFPAGVGTCSVTGSGVTGSGGVYSCPAGTVISIESDLDDEDYIFDHFEINGSSYTDDPCSFTVGDENVTITAVFVSWAPHTVDVTVNPSEGGSAYYDGADMVEPGETVEIHWEANPGYHYVSWEIVSGTVSGKVTYESESRCEFTMGSTDVTVRVNFAENASHNISYTVSSGDDTGSVTGPSSAAEGSSVTVSFSPADDYVLDDWTVSGGNAERTGDATFTMGSADATVTAAFKPRPMPTDHSITTSVSPEDCGCSILVASQAMDDETVTVAFDTADGWALSSWSVSGGGAVKIDESSFRMGNDDVVVYGYFTSTTGYTLTLSGCSPANSATLSVAPTPNSDGRYLPGTMVTIEAEANEGYQVESMNVGGVPIEGSTYSFAINANTSVTIYCKTLTKIVVTQPDSAGGSVRTGTFYKLPGETFTVDVLSTESGYSFYLTVNGETMSSGQQSFTIGDAAVYNVVVTFFLN